MYMKISLDIYKRITKDKITLQTILGGYKVKRSKQYHLKYYET